jgi:hypothetical protein
LAKAMQKVNQMLVGCNHNQTSQKPCQMTIKSINLITYVYVMPFYCHTNHGKLCLMINLKVKESQLNCQIFQIQVLFCIHDLWNEVGVNPSDKLIVRSSLIFKIQFFYIKFFDTNKELLDTPKQHSNNRKWVTILFVEIQSMLKFKSFLPHLNVV